MPECKQCCGTCKYANYDKTDAMFRFMFPQEGDFFQHTGSDESAGIIGMSVKEMEEFKREHSFED